MKRILMLISVCCVAGCSSLLGPSYDADTQWIYTGDLHTAIESATRLHVRTGGTCHGSDRNAKTLLDIVTEPELSTWKRRIQFEKVNSCWHCMCCGNPTFEWYAGTNCLAKVSMHGDGKSMRWRGHWQGDASLTEESAAWLAQWLGPEKLDLQENLQQ